jgi:uncharacterized protein (TIGR00299 family) protein
LKVLYLDPFSGISGDMFLASLFDTGFSHKKLEEELKKGGIKGFEIKAKKVKLKGLRGTRVEVKGGERQVFKNYREFKKILKGLSFKKSIKDDIKLAFEILFSAESRAHGKKNDEVHLHELGTLDTLVDIAGAIVSKEILGIERVYSAPVNVGGGFIKSSHGLLPAPSPLTLDILKGFPLFREGTGELTTPTGAVILKVLKAEFNPSMRFSPEKIGYGIGRYENNPFPDALRAIICNEVKEEEIIVIETNIDDMPPFMFEDLFEKAFQNGALEVYITPVIMKKSRPGYVVSILCEKKKLTDLSSVLFRTTTTIGLRYYPVGRIELLRKKGVINFGGEKIIVKKAYWNGKLTNFSYEYSSVKKTAEKKGMTVKEVLNRLNKKIEE